jgi:transcription-repair coupling factor (superfamily II helicase)
MTSQNNTHTLHLNELLGEGAKVLNQAQRLQILGSSDAVTQLIAMTATMAFDKVVLIVPTHRDASPLLHCLEQNRSLLSRHQVSMSYLPHLSMWGTDRFINPSLSRNQRLDALFNLRDPATKHITVTTLAGLFQATLTADLWHRFTVKIRVGEDIDQDDLIKRLTEAGYHASTVVDEEGLFSVRGSVLDVYAPNLDFPLRLEFMGDQITSIRMFNLDDQKSKKSLETALIGPAHESLQTSDHRKDAAQRLHEHLLTLDSVSQHDKDGFRGAFITGSKPAGWDLLAPIIRSDNSHGFALLPDQSCLFFTKGLDPALASYGELLDHFIAAHGKDEKAGRVTLDPLRHFPSRETVSKLLGSAPQVIEAGSAFHREGFSRITLSTEKGFEGVSANLSSSARFESWTQAMANLIQLDRGKICILTSSAEQEDRIATLLTHRDLPVARKAMPLDALIASAPDEKIHVMEGFLSSWIWVSQTRTLMIPEHVIFGVTQRKQKSSSAKLKNFLSSFRDLKVGDLIVHVTHGVGRYRGMITLTVGGITADFLHLEYAGTDKIYLPVDKLNLLQRYSAGGEGGSNPSLDKLGGSAWEKKKSQVKAAVKEMADKLLKLQAQRALAHIHTYDPPTDEYFKFEAEFPYEETADQIKAIEEVNQDLEGQKAMDRLICGDVGFGKTEVALRAAFRVASEGLQVLVLVPTTILCYQHYRTFSDRLNRHGLRVAQVNRFVPAKEQKTVLADLAAGKVDVLIGTHRLLSEDIKTRRLGLIIVDEEQRFGVGHKEKLKELRAGADILTLTATPIPRTLHMSMLGLRDISIITTPPSNRMSVKTYVARMDESLIREALEHEIDRGGQAFFLHNRVEDIEATTLWIKSLVPKAQVRFAHGQMRETDLENTIIDFIEHKFDVLVCTTIIESGVDMPNVNTLLVSQADRFGLAQLYQMRGRVGRSSVQAYAYFLTKSPESLTEEARRRLEVLAAHQELGAGFQIASHDLEIRGAGNLLGAEQSGHAAEVGLEMYTDLLGEAIAELRGQMPERPKIDTEIKIPITALIPDSYIKDEGLRLQFYKTLFSVDRRDEVEDIAHELMDRFGPIPEELARLIMVAKLKIMLSVLGATQISMNPKGGWFEIRFGSLNERQIDRMIKEAHRKPQTYRLSPDYRLYVYWDRSGNAAPLESTPQTDVIKHLLELMEPMTAGLESA